MIEFVGTGVVEVFALEIDLGAAKFFRKSGGVVGRGRAALEMLSDAAEFLDEIVRA